MGKRKAAAPAKRAPTEAEKAAADSAKQAVKSAPVRASPMVDIVDGSATISAEHSDETASTYMMMDALGTSSNGFTSRGIRDILNTAGAIGSKPASTEDLQAAFAFVGAICPQNELEAALAVQMFATHTLAIDMIGRARTAATRPVLNEYGNLATKMQRTFTAQLDALTKLRTGGKQVVEHRHVYVDNRGGQAVFAENVNTGGKGNERTLETQSHAPSAALLGSDAAGYALPGSDYPGPEAVQASRRKGWRPQGK